MLPNAEGLGCIPVELDPPHASTKDYACHNQDLRIINNFLKERRKESKRERKEGGRKAERGRKKDMQKGICIEFPGGGAVNRPFCFRRKLNEMKVPYRPNSCCP